MARMARSIILYIVFSLASSFAVALPSATQDIVTFVEQTYVHGIPIEDAMKFNESDAAKLLPMLSDKRLEQYWPNVVVTLGLAGGTEVAKPLITFLESGDGPVSSSEYAAKTSTLMSLGYLINRTHSSAALDYLKSSVDPSVWAGRRLRWTVTFQKPAAMNRQLSSAAINGLALAGVAEARTALERVLNSRRLISSLGPGAQGQLREAISANRFIEQNGIVAYYRKFEWSRNRT